MARFARARWFALLLAVACGLGACAAEHSPRRLSDAMSSVPDDSAAAPAADDADLDAGSTTETGVDHAEDAEAEPRDAESDTSPARDASHITCQLCLDYTHGPSLYVHNARDHSCTVLRLVWELGCDGLDVGRSELCLQSAELWPHAASCPAMDAGVPLLAQSARGYVVGHEGIIGIQVQLTFAGEAGVTNVPVDLEECGADYLETKPPCP